MKTTLISLIILTINSSQTHEEKSDSFQLSIVITGVIMVMMAIFELGVAVPKYNT